MKCLPAIGVFTLMTVFALSVLAFAGIPQTINYQGYLKDGSGAPVNGATSMTFSLYSSVTPRNNPVWQENQPKVPVTNGIYSTQLGSATPITVPFDVPYSGVRDYVAEVPVIQGEVTVQGGLSYSLWLSAGPISGGNSTAHCYLARSSTETSDNMLIRFTPGAPGL